MQTVEAKPTQSSSSTAFARILKLLGVLYSSFMSGHRSERARIPSKAADIESCCDMSFHKTQLPLRLYQRLNERSF